MVIANLIELSKDCWNNKHDVYEDMIINENCEERVFFCKTCKKIFVCIEENNKIFVKIELPISTTNKEVSKYLTWF